MPLVDMGEKRSSGEKKGKVNLRGLNGGGVVVVVGGALVAAAAWSVSEFMKRRKSGCKKGSLKGFQTPNSEKPENFDDSGDVLESEGGDYDIHGEFDATSQKSWDVNKKLPLKTHEEEDCKCRKGAAPAQNYYWDGDRQMLVGIVDKKEEWEYDEEDLSNVHEYESALVPLVEDIPQLEDVEAVTTIVHPRLPAEIVADLEHEKSSDDSEGSYAGTSDSSAESNTVAVWPEEMLSQAINDIKPISNDGSEIIEQDCRGTLSSGNNNSIHLSKNYKGSVSIYRERMAIHSTRTVTVLRVLLVAMLVLMFSSLLSDRALVTRGIPENWKSSRNS